LVIAAKLIPPEPMVTESTPEFPTREIPAKVGIVVKLTVIVPNLESTVMPPAELEIVPPLVAVIVSEFDALLRPYLPATAQHYYRPLSRLCRR